MNTNLLSDTNPSTKPCVNAELLNICEPLNVNKSPLLNPTTPELFV